MTWSALVAGVTRAAAAHTADRRRCRNSQPATSFPLLEDATVVTGTMDAWGSVYGSGVVDHGDAMEVAGTSEILALFSRERHPAAGVVSFLAVEGSTCTPVRRRPVARRSHGSPGSHGLTVAEVVDTRRLARRPAADGLIFMPHLLGERAPLWDSDVAARSSG